MGSISTNDSDNIHDRVSTTSSRFPDLNYLKIILLTGFIHVFILCISNISINTLLELEGLPHDRHEKKYYIVSNFNYFQYMVPVAVILVSYLTDKYGAKKTVSLSIYAISILIVLLSISPNLFFIRITLIGLGLSSGLKAIPYGLIAILYESKHQSFAYTLLFINQILSGIIYYIIIFFKSYKNQIPNWFILKLVFLQYPQLFNALCSAIIILIFGYYSRSLLLPLYDKSDTTSLSIRSDETQTLISDIDNTNYNSINSSQDALYFRFIPKLPTERTVLLIVSYILTQFLITNAMIILLEWYMLMFEIDKHDLGLGFESFFPIIIFFVVVAFLLSYLYLPSTLNKFNPSYVYNITCTAIVIEFAYLIVVIFLQLVLPTFFITISVTLIAISLPICFLYSNFSVMLLLAKVEDRNVGKFTVFGLAFGGYGILKSVQTSINFKDIFAYFGIIENYWIIFVKVFLIILIIIAFLNRYLSQIIFVNNN